VIDARFAARRSCQFELEHRLFSSERETVNELLLNGDVMSQDTFQQEGGLRAPPGLGFWGKAWWWFHFLILVKLARLRFLAVLLVIGLVIVKWDTLVKYYERWARTAEHNHAAGGDFEWFCPMHPAIVRDNPKEKCPICFMPLSKRKKDDRGDEALPPGIASRVQLSPYRVVLAGVQTWTVAPVAVHKEISTVGFVEFNEREMKHVAARIKGRIDKLFVSETGQMVHAGDELASLYSPDILLAMQNLVDAQRANDAAQLKSVQDRLLRWGASDKQLAEVAKTGNPHTHLKISSPISGHVLKKFVKEGQYVDEGSPLYDVVDLTTVWIQAQVYEDDMTYLPGNDCPIKEAKDKREPLTVTATTRAYPNEQFAGRLTFIFPHVDLETRSVVVRFELANTDHKLRPGTSVTAKIRIPPAKLPALGQSWVRSWQQRSGALAAAQVLAGTPLGLGLAEALPAAGEFAQLLSGHVLAVPESALIDTGAHKIVYREVLPGDYEGVLVELGARLLGPGDAVYYPIVSGLNAGDRIVTAGSFLIDAETRLNPAAGSIYIGGSGSRAAPNSVRPSTPDEGDGKIRAALSKLNENDRRLATGQQFCVVQTHTRLGAMGVPVKLMVQGQPVFICCVSCEDKALSEPEQTLAEVARLKKSRADAAAEDAAIAADLAKLNVKDRRLAQEQRFCAVNNENRLGSMGVPVKLMIQGQPVYLCCEGCRDEALANAARSLERVNQLRKTHGKK
jgi:Cu(I)/Ag(I) efflux system membrane fusion protein